MSDETDKASEREELERERGVHFAPDDIAQRFVLGDGAGPFGGGQGFAPPGLGLAADHADAADLLELEAVAGIKEAVAIPVAH